MVGETKFTEKTEEWDTLVDGFLLAARSDRKINAVKEGPGGGCAIYCRRNVKYHSAKTFHPDWACQISSTQLSDPQS